MPTKPRPTRKTSVAANEGADEGEASTVIPARRTASGGSGRGGHAKLKEALRDRVLDDLEASTEKLVDVASRHGITGHTLSRWVGIHRPELASVVRLRGGLDQVPDRFLDDSVDETRLTAILIVICHPVRRAILKVAAQGPVKQVDFKHLYEMSDAAWSHHFTKMLEVDLFAVQGQGRNRTYTLKPNALRLAASALAELAGGELLFPAGPSVQGEGR